MKQLILIVAIILMAGMVHADDPNAMPNPPKNGVTYCLDEVHRTFTLRIDMSSVDRWFLANSPLFRQMVIQWVSRIPTFITDLKKQGAVKWMNRQTLAQTEVERTKE